MMLVDLVNVVALFIIVIMSFLCVFFIWGIIWDSLVNNELKRIYHHDAFNPRKF
mgnify:CR=1 FL=1